MSRLGRQMNLADAALAGLPIPDERAKREQTTFLAYRDENDLVADFHALRHTFISNLANSGVHPKTAQMGGKKGSRRCPATRRLSDSIPPLPGEAIT